MYSVIGVIKRNNRIVAYDLLHGDGEVERRSKEDVIGLIKGKRISNASIQIYQGKEIIRVKHDNKPLNQVPIKEVRDIKHISNVSGKNAINILNHLKVGSPLRVKVSKNYSFEQVIYLGISEVQNTIAYNFFNGKGISGYFALSERFINNNLDNVELEFSNNDACEVNYLLKIIKEEPFNFEI